MEGFNVPLRQYFSLYRAASREGEKDQSINGQLHKRAFVALNSV